MKTSRVKRSSGFTS